MTVCVYMYIDENVFQGLVISMCTNIHVCVCI